MRYRWHVNYHEQGFTQPGNPKEFIPTTTVMEGKTKEEALAAFLQKNPRVIRDSVRVSKKASPICETYEELAEWLKAHKVSPEEAQGGVQVMVINSRPENIEPYDCPNCGFDLNQDIDHHHNAYFCPKCKALIQTG